MNSEEIDEEESPSSDKELVLSLPSHSELEMLFEGFISDSELENISDDLEELRVLREARVLREQDSSTEKLGFLEEIDELFVVEEVGHSCDLCQRDLGTDPERPNASLSTLQEACVLACGHVYHFKYLQCTTIDLNNCSDPSCILGIS